MLFVDGSFGTHALPIRGFVVAWMPLSELRLFDPIPDPPEGWRFVEKGEAFDKRAKFWSKTSGSWLLTGHSDDYSKVYTYIVPIDPPAPPEPQYRPFANAAEFEPHKDRWWRYKSYDADCQFPPMFFSDAGHHTQDWLKSFENKVFSDGSPFGVRVEQ
jgi:hypothetical protein